MKDVVGMAGLKRTATTAATLPVVEVVAAVVEEVVVLLELVEEELVVVNNRTTPRMSLKILHLNLNLKHNPPNRSLSSLNRNNLNHKSQTNNNSRSPLPQKPLPAVGQQAT